MVEWGSEWQVQQVSVQGNKGGQGVNAVAEYTTAAIDPVNRDQTWVWATGHRADGGIGDCAEAVVVTLGNGVNQNETENTVAVGSEYKDAYHFEVYTMSHPSLSVEHVFKADGDASVLDKAISLTRPATQGSRLAWSYNTVNGTGAAFPRPRMWSRYLDDETIELSRGYDGQAYAAWVQGIDFSAVGADQPGSSSIRATEYHITGGAFSGTTYRLTLNQDLAQDYFILVRGSREGDGESHPDNDYVRVISVPGARDELSDSGALNQIILRRKVADHNWEGVITVMESLANGETSGFKLREVLSTKMTAGVTSGSDSNPVEWTNIEQVVPFGGYRGGGVEFTDEANHLEQGTSVYARVYPRASDNKIAWERDGAGQSLLTAWFTTFVVEWGSQWQVQQVSMQGAKGGQGIDSPAEYTTAGIDPIGRDQTWVWATGHRADGGIGDGAEAVVVTLGDGVNQNDIESTVAVGSEYADAYHFEVYTMSHPSLSVEHVFKADGDASVSDKEISLTEPARQGSRLAWSYNTVNGTGAAFPRPRMWSRLPG